MKVGKIYTVDWDAREGRVEGNNFDRLRVTPRFPRTESAEYVIPRLQVLASSARPPIIVLPVAGLLLRLLALGISKTGAGFGYTPFSEERENECLHTTKRTTKPTTLVRGNWVRSGGFCFQVRVDRPTMGAIARHCVGISFARWRSFSSSVWGPAVRATWGSECNRLDHLWGGRRGCGWCFGGRGGLPMS